GLRSSSGDWERGRKIGYCINASKKLDMMNRIAYIMIALVFAALKTNAQPKEYYFKSSEMKGFPSSLKQLANYGSVHQKLGYFQLDEKTYNRLFYRSFITESSPNAGFRKMDII